LLRRILQLPRKERKSKQTLFMDKILAVNRAAKFHYELLEQFTAGLILQGHEAKALKIQGGNLKGAYIISRQGKIFLRGLHISRYKHARLEDYDPKRERELLLSKREIFKITEALAGKGISCIPLSVELKNNWLKVSIALARGRKKYEKREVLKKREVEMRMARRMKVSL
jgi:SsrA-binding protein